MRQINISKILLLTCISASVYSSCQLRVEKTKNLNLERAEATLNAIYDNYSAPNTNLLRETYPFDDTYSATYLASADQAQNANQYAYLWPYSGTVSAVNALIETTKDEKYKKLLDTKVLNGLNEYYDDTRQPAAYASYIKDAPISDRFYDDNVWLGIDFTDTYILTNENKYLDKAKMIWDFIVSGMDEKLDGGIYWCEQKKESKNTCSNAPGSVYALKLFNATGDSTYYQQGKYLYEWTKDKLQDTIDNLYFDNINLDGKISNQKYAYNSGQMIQAAALLYQLTDDEEYLKDAQAVASACHRHFFHDFTSPNGELIRFINKGDVWFTAVMLRGFIELYHIDNNRTYLEDFNKSLDYAWHNATDEKGLFNTDLTGKDTDNQKWLLTQAAIVEMYGRLARII